MKIKKIELIMGSHLAGYLINADQDNISDNEIYKLESFLEENGTSSAHCIDCKDEGFVWRPDFGLAGDCQVYTFRIV
jgi:hypothetical protein